MHAPSARPDCSSRRLKPPCSVFYTVHKLLAALGRLAYCNDGAGALAATLGIGAVLARQLSTATAADRDLILQLQLVLPTD